MSGRMTGLLAAIVLAAGSGSTYAEPQWITNPQMALDGDGPLSWRFIDFGTGCEARVTATEGRDGSSAVGVRVETASERGCWMQRLDVGAHRFVTVRGWYRTEGLEPAHRRGAMLRLTYRNQGEYIGDHRYYLPPADSWQSFEFIDRTLDSDGLVEVELFNFFGPGTVWFDDVNCLPGSAEGWSKQAAEQLDRPPAKNQVGYSPGSGSTLSFTPPAFRWVPVSDVDSYVVQWSRSADFSGDSVQQRDASLCIYTPCEPLASGVWWWRYGMPIGDTDMVAWSRARQFEIESNAMTFPRPRTEEVLALVDRARPRVFFTPATLREIRQTEDPVLRAMVRSTAQGAERYLGEDLYPEPPRLPKEHTARRNAYQHIYHTMRPWTAGMERCALAYLLTGDRRFGEEAKRRLLHFASWDPSGSTSVFHNDEPAMDLAKRGPRSYDWIADLLTPEERQRVIASWRVRLKEINQLHRRMPFESKPYTSHPGRMVPFMVEGSMVFLHEIEEAREWLDYTLHLMWNTYPAWGSADGGWHEGPSYWGAYIGMMTRNVFGFGELGELWKKKPFFRNTGYYGLYAVPAFAKQRPFGDGHGGSVSATQARILYNHASLHDNPYYRWYAEIMGVDSGSGPEAFLAYRPDLDPIPPVNLPQAHAFDNIGLVAMHSNLSDPTGAVQMLFKSDPYGSVSHNHASQNAFAINAFGEALAISSGYYQQYGCPHHAQWTWDTRAHNSITINGEGQVKRSRDSQGRIVRYWNDDRITYCLGDATAAYGGRLERFYRHVVFLRPHTFVMLDDLAAPQPVSAEWRLHARAEMAVDPERRALTIAQGNARLKTRFLLPQAVEISQTDEFTVTPHVPTSPNQWHASVTPSQDTSSPVFVSVLRAYREGDEALADQVATVERLGQRYRTTVQHKPSVSTVELSVGSPTGPQEERGVLTVVTRESADNALEGYVCYEGSQLTDAGQALLTASGPVAVSVQLGDRAVRIMLDARQQTECELHVPARYASVVTGDAEIMAGHEGDTLRVRVPAGSHELVLATGAQSALKDAVLTGPDGEDSRPMACTPGALHTAWLGQSDGLPAGLCEALVQYRAPDGGSLIVTAGASRHEWQVESGGSETRFRFVMPTDGRPLVVINPHGTDGRIQLTSVTIQPLASAGALAPATLQIDEQETLRIEAETFVSHTGLADTVRTGDYVCSGALVYGLGDLVTRLAYDVDVPEAGTYRILFKHATDRAQTALRLLVNGQAPADEAQLMLFGPTGGWGYAEDQWRIHVLEDAAGHPVPVTLKRGSNRLVLEGRGGRMHLDWMALEPLP